jgi:hypothetical protein
MRIRLRRYEVYTFTEAADLNSCVTSKHLHVITTLKILQYNKSEVRFISFVRVTNTGDEVDFRTFSSALFLF